MSADDFWRFYDNIKESQTFQGIVQFMLTIIPWGFIFAYANNYYNGDRFHFKCDLASDVAIRNCYQQYENELNPLLTPLTFIIIVGVLPLVLWIIFGVAIVTRMASLQVGKTASSRPVRSEEEVLLLQSRKEPKLLFKIFCSHTVLRLACLIVGLVLLLLYQKINIPPDYPCISRKSNVRFNCTDFRSSEKTDINHAILVVNGVLSMLAIVELIYSFYRARKRWGGCPTDKEFSFYLKGKWFY